MAPRKQKKTTAKLTPTGTTYLIAGPGAGSKLDAAHEFGTCIISEYHLVRLLGKLTPLKGTDKP